MSEPRRWVILTGEYPPQPGGVADYTRLIAEGLGARGDQVDVWAPRCEGPEPAPAPGVWVHRLPGSFGPLSLRRLARGIEAIPRPFRVLVQYVPHAYGAKALNLAFSTWLYAQRGKWPIWVMFHEVAFPWNKRPWRRTNLLAAGHRGMAAMVVRAAQRAFVAIPAWRELLKGAAPAGLRFEWLPVPSNVATEADLIATASVRRELGVAEGGRLLGSFGTLGPDVLKPLVAILPGVLAAERDAKILLIGRYSREVAAKFIARHPHLAAKVWGTGPLDAEAVAAHIAACELMLQPYRTGLSSRRGSVMACLGLGRPVLSTSGPDTEPVWSGQDAVALYPRRAPEVGVALARSLLADPAELRALGGRGMRLYDERFALDRSLDALQRAANAEDAERA